MHINCLIGGLQRRRVLREAYDNYLIPMAEKWVREHCLRQALEAVLTRAAAKMKELLTAGPYNFESPRLVSCVIGDETVCWRLRLNAGLLFSVAYSLSFSLMSCADSKLFGGAEP